MAMSGDRSIRRLEDAGSQVNQFAMAKAIASGDPRLMQKAGLEAELARLDRLRDAHFDDQYAIRRTIHDAERSLAASTGRIAQIEQDIAQRTHTRGDLFTMDVEGKTFVERKDAGAALLKTIRHREFDAKAGEWRLGNIGGFELFVTAIAPRGTKIARIELTMQRTGWSTEIEYGFDVSALGLISRLEYCLVTLRGGTHRTKARGRRRRSASSSLSRAPWRRLRL